MEKKRKEKKYKYSYLKKPFSKDGWLSFGMGILTVFMTGVVAFRAVACPDMVGLFEAAVGMSCIVLDVMGIWFAVLTASERDSNRTFSLAGFVICLTLLVLWLAVAVYGTV